MQQCDTQPGGDLFDIPFDRERHVAFLDLTQAACPVQEVLAWNVRTCCEARAAGKAHVDAVVLTGESREAFDALAVCYTSPGLRHFTHLRDRDSFTRLRRAAGFEATTDSHHAVINRFFAATGAIPFLAVPPVIRIWAEGYLKAYNPGTLIVTVQAGLEEERGAWEAFWDAARERHPDTVFLVLGSPQGWSSRTLRRSDIIFPQRQGLGLLERLALLQAGDLFFGRCGALAGMASFSGLPSVLFVPPRDAARIAREWDVAQGAATLPFAGADQRLCWDIPDAATLLTVFAAAVSRRPNPVPLEQAP